MEAMEMTRRSQATGQWHTRTLPMSNLPLLLWSQGEPRETCSPQLTPEERHVLATGITPDSLLDDAQQETP